MLIKDLFTQLQFNRIAQNFLFFIVLVTINYSCSSTHSYIEKNGKVSFMYNDTIQIEIVFKDGIIKTHEKKNTKDGRTNYVQYDTCWYHNFDTSYYKVYVSQIENRMNGLLHGTSYTYYKSGILLESSEYKFGILNGDVIKFDSIGNFISKSTYKEGELVGEPIYELFVAPL